MSWYMVINAQQQGPFEPHELSGRGMRAETLVWREGMNDWQRADAVPELRHLLLDPRHAPTHPPPYPSHPHSPHPPHPPHHVPGWSGQVDYRTPAPPQYNPAASNRIAAGVCGILLGSLGIHKFILGFTGAGVIMLLATLLTCGIAGMVTSVIGIIEGIIYLTKSEEEFYHDYVVQRRQWF